MTSPMAVPTEMKADGGPPAPAAPVAARLGTPEDARSSRAFSFVVIEANRAAGRPRGN
jgi:hypothetical protein